MNITHIGTSINPTPTRTLTLNNVLHVLSTHKNLIFIHRFTIDNCNTPATPGLAVVTPSSPLGS
jgi:hypothetical protein